MTTPTPEEIVDRLGGPLSSTAKRWLIGMIRAHGVARYCEARDAAAAMGRTYADSVVEAYAREIRKLTP